MYFLDVVEGELEFQGTDGKTYSIPPTTLKQWGKYVTWVQFQEYRDACNAELPRRKLEEIYDKCREGMVPAKVLPDEWYETHNKEDKPKEEDYVIEDKPIHIFSRPVLDSFGKQEADLYLLSLCFKDKYPKKDLEDVVTPEQTIKLRIDFLKVNGLLDKKEKPQTKERKEDENPTQSVPNQ